MTRDEAVEEIKQGLSYRRDGDDEIVTALQRAQGLLERPGRTLPYFLIEENATLVTVAGTQTVALPTGFIKEVDGFGLRYSYDGSVSPNVKFLKKSSDSQIRAYYTDESGTVIEGGPDQYILLKESIRIYPIPDAVYTLYWDFYKEADSLTTNIENAWLEHNPDILIGLAGQRVAARKRDQAAVGLFTGQYNDGLRQLISDNEERDWANRHLYKGSKT
jgi:hypothetical protein